MNISFFWKLRFLFIRIICPFTMYWGWRCTREHSLLTMLYAVSKVECHTWWEGTTHLASCQFWAPGYWDCKKKSHGWGDNGTEGFPLFASCWILLSTNWPVQSTYNLWRLSLPTFLWTEWLDGWNGVVGSTLKRKCTILRKMVNGLCPWDFFLPSEYS